MLLRAYNDSTAGMLAEQEREHLGATCDFGSKIGNNKLLRSPFKELLADVVRQCKSVPSSRSFVHSENLAQSAFKLHGVDDHRGCSLFEKCVQSSLCSHLQG